MANKVKSKYIPKHERIKLLNDLSDPVDRKFVELCLKRGLRISEYPEYIKICYANPELKEFRFTPKKKNYQRKLINEYELVKELVDAKISFNKDALTKRFQRISKEIGFKVTVHDTRKTFGTNLAKAGLNPWQIKVRMGHKNIKSTEQYIDEAELDDTSLDKYGFDEFHFDSFDDLKRKYLILEQENTKLRNKLENKINEN